MAPVIDFPNELEVCIDTPLGGRVKRRDDGRIEFVSPIACPFNYGSVLDSRAPDGDREDVIVLGDKLERGECVRVPVLGRVRFIDAGKQDHKWLCGDSLTQFEINRIRRFFKLYTRAKRLLNVFTGAYGVTRFEGIELPETSLPHVALPG
jgi:inorganic pyrophosphatase